MSSLRAKLIRSVTRAYVRRVDIANADVSGIRRIWHTLANLLPTAFGVQVQRDEINGLTAEWLTPKNAADDKLLIFLHGGGYVVGGCAMYRQLVSHIARAGRIRALLPEYRLAPEHKFPAAIDDAVAIYRSLLDTGIRPENMMIAGDSAGGGLSVATLLTLRDAGDPLPAAVILMSPFLDATASGESMKTRADRDPWFRAEDVPVIANHYCEPHQRNFPLVSPVFASVEGLPPAYIQVGDHEILLSDSERFADLCVAAGIDVTLEIWPEMFHVFQMCVNKMPESKQAILKIGAYIQERLET